MERKSLIVGLLVLAASGALIAVASVTFFAQHEVEPIVKGPGVTRVVKLSEYYEGLKGTAGDTDVYILEGSSPGASMLVLGGTHPPEPSGLVAATLLVENVTVRSGRLFVIPHANASGYTWTEPGQGHPIGFTIKTEWGERWFRFGSRGTNPVHQWPDPELYIHYPSGQRLSADEVRNLNRNHPGKAGGTLTEKVGFGISSMIKAENITVSIDQHEAPPEKPLINAAAVHERAMDLMGWVVLNLEMQDFRLRLEASPKDLHGLSHREWGDHTDTLAILLETPNASQGAIRGRTDAALVVEGTDEFYVAAAKLKRTMVPFDESGWPLVKRVGRQTTAINEIARTYTELNPGNPLVLENVPVLNDLMEKGLGHYLLPVP